MFRCMFSFMSAWRRSDTMFTFMFSFISTQRRSYTMVRCMFSFISIQRRSETMFRYMFSFISIQRRSETMFRYMFSFISTPWSDPTPCSDIVSSLPGEDPIPYSAFRCQCDFMLITPWRGSCITFGCQCDFMVLFVCLVPSLSGEDPSSHLGVGVISWCCLSVWFHDFLERILHHIQVSVWFYGVVCLSGFITSWRGSFITFRCWLIAWCCLSV